MVDSSGSSMMEEDDEYLDNEAESSHHHGSDSESSDHHGSDSHVDGHVHPDDASDENIELEVANEENDSEVLDSEYVNKLIVGSDKSFDYYGDSDLETCDNVEVFGNVIKEKEYKGECDRDIGHPGEEREKYWKIMDMTFVSEPAAYYFYNSYAKDHGFSIRKSRYKENKKASHDIHKRQFVCSREGKRSSKYLPLKGRKYKPRAESRCGCTTQLVVKLDKSKGVWCVEKFDDKHNHILARPDEVPFLWSHRKIKDFQRAEILAMAASGIRKHMIMSSFISKYGRYNQVGFTRKDLYNMCAREKRKLLSSGDAATAIGIMQSRKEKDPDFFYDHQLDDKGRLKCLFWCDSQSRQDYQDYSDVLVFDNTYKMNRYGMPFVPFVGLNNHRKTTIFGCAIISNETEDTYAWLLKTFLKAMSQKRPRSIITDADAAMMRAIRSVLPDVWHRICTWHIEKNMCKHLSSKSLPEFWSLLYYSTTKAKFKEEWHAYVRKWQTDKTKPWLNRMYKRKHLWAAAYLADGFWLGMKRNQCRQSLNSSLHLHLDYGMTLVDLIMHYENAIVRIRETEARDDCTALQTMPVIVTKWQQIKLAMASTFTPANFYILQDDLRKIEGMTTVEKSVGIENSVRYLVAWSNNRRHNFSVDYTPNNPAQSIDCNCRRMVRRGIPCKHILFMLTELKLVELPRCIVLARFSKNARSGLPSRRTSDLFGWGFAGAEERSRYSELRVMSSEALHVACNNPELYKQVKTL
uniref:Uncharacterized protein n=1 Tax=Avena sativa TaxID=4498 RepID=A0ACD5V8N2_AVESA